MSQQDIFRWIRQLVKLHYPRLHACLEKGRLAIHEIPIVTYCWNSKCTSSEMAVKYLMQKGFVDVSEYKGGLQEYKKYYST